MEHPLNSEPNRPSARFSGRFMWLAWLFVVVVILTPRILDLDVFYARDELAIWPWADQFTLAVWQGNPAGTLTDSDYPGIPMFWGQTLFLSLKYRLPALFPNTMIPVEELFRYRSLPFLAERRLVVGVLVTVQLVTAVWLARQLFGWRAALLSAILLGLDPFSLTEARVVRLEMVSAGFVCLSLLAYLLYRQSRLRRWALVSGIMAGLGVSGKTSAGLIVPYIWLLLLLDLLPHLSISHLRISNLQISNLQTPNLPLSRLQSLITTGLLWAGGAIAAFWLIWPAMWVEPLAALEHLWRTGFAQAADRSVWGDKVFFWGQLWPGDPGPWFYPVALAFRTTPLAWIGVAAAVAWLLLRIRPSPISHPPSPISQLLLFILVLLLELTFIVSKVDRFMLIFFPALNILAAVGLDILITYASRAVQHGRRALHDYLPAGLALLVLVVQLTQTIPAHPYYYTYWNPLLGGGRVAMDLLPVGAGEGIDRAMAFLNRQPDAADSTVVCGASEPWCRRTFTGHTLRSASYVSGEWITADYATLYISHLQRHNYPAEVVEFLMSQEPLYRVELNGATYALVFTVPDVPRFAGPWNDLAGQARLLGFDLGQPTQPAGGVVNAGVWWVNMGAGVGNLVVRLVDRSGYEWARAPVRPLPEYADIPPEQTAVVAGQAAVELPPGMPPGSYFWRIGVVNEAARLVGEFSLPDDAGNLAVAPGSPITDPARFNMAVRLDDSLAPEVKLLGYTPPAQVINAQTPVWLSLYWQAVRMPPDYQVVLRLVDKTGQEAARWQGKPGYNTFPMTRWQPGQIVQDVWPLQVDPQTPPGQYNLLISLDGPDLQSPNPQSLIYNLQVWPQPLSFDIPDMQARVNIPFDNRLTLLGYDLYFDTGGSAGGRLSPVFYWQSNATFTAAFDIILTLRDAGTNQPLRTWQVPLGSNQARQMWQAGEVVGTPFEFEAGALVGGRYHLDIALQNRASGQPVFSRPAGGPESPFVRIENIQDKIVVRVDN